MKKFLILLLLIAVGLLIVNSGAAGPPNANVAPEACLACHRNTGVLHQASYNELFQTDVMEATDLTFAYNTKTKKATMTFKLEKNGAAFDCRPAGKFLVSASWFGIVYASWDAKLGGFPVSLDLVDGLGYFPSRTPPTKTYDYTNNTCTVITAPLNAADDAVASGITASNGFIQLYGAAESTNHATLAIAEPEAYPLTSKGKYTFAAIKKFGTVDYVSKANVSGCEKCHMKPYMPAHIEAIVSNASAPEFAAQGTGFVTCVACHQLGKDGSWPWGLLAEDPAAYAAQKGKMTPAQKTKYAYKATLRNVTHRVHAMKAAYPQSMENCVTCHEGKLDKILTAANFKGDTCKSCHPVNASGLRASGNTTTGVTQVTQRYRAQALKTIMSAKGCKFVDFDHLETATCSTSQCHTKPDAFSKMHTGYNKVIYANASGDKYSELFTVTIDDATYENGVLNLSFSATESSPDISPLTVADIKPAVYVGLYGSGTKDFVADIQAEVVKKSDGHWNASLDLSKAAKKLDLSAKRVEILVLPTLMNDDYTVALNAPSRTFDLSADAFVAPQASGVDVNKCNTCHTAISTTFHSPNQGGNIVACRVCHSPVRGSRRLEMQSDSLDSIIHAIHSYQPFDAGKIDFTDPVQKVHYDLVIGTDFPTFGITNCEACHNPGTYEVPDQSKWLPAKLSGAHTVAGRDSINGIPSYVTSPASRACGSCHRAKMINDGKGAQLKAFNEKMKRLGYLVEDDTDVLKSSSQK